MDDGRARASRRPRAAALRLWLAAVLRELARPLVAGFIILAIAIDVVHLYTYWPDLDVPMHYAAALVLTYVMHRSLQHAMRYEVLPQLDWFPRAVTLFALVSSASVFWELGEFLSDRYLGTRAQGGLADTMWDMLINAFGAVSFLAAWTLIRIRRRGMPPH